jgi:hypothetical protein
VKLIGNSPLRRYKEPGYNICLLINLLSNNRAVDAVSIVEKVSAGGEESRKWRKAVESLLEERKAVCVVVLVKFLNNIVGFRELLI